MNLRIIAGEYGGRITAAPKGFATHPMGDRVRSSLFNMIINEVKNADVLDAFAGSGAIGLEALSRGAKSATFVERDRAAFKVLTDNIKTLGAESKTSATQMNISSWIEKNKDKRYDVIFTDPPYNDTQFSTVPRLCELLSPNGTMILSYPGRGDVPTVQGYVVVDSRRYGNAALAFYRKK